jgi:outer membrane protein TolC
MKHTLQTTLFLLAGLVAPCAFSHGLMQVYRQALQSDPIFAQAESTWHAQKMNLPIAEAGYLPKVSVGANSGRYYSATRPSLGFKGVHGNMVTL